MTEDIRKSTSGIYDIEQRKISAAREFFETIIVAVIFTLILRTFLVQAFFIPSSSMEKTLLRQDRIMVNMFSFQFRKPKRGDVTVFTFPQDPTKSFIKRLIGEPGDKISIIRGKVHVNGIPLVEPYTEELCRTDFVEYQTDVYKTDRGLVPKRAGIRSELTVPENHYFMMGDNRNNSEDSRFWGSLHQDYIRGRAIFVYWPFSRMMSIKAFRQ